MHLGSNKWFIIIIIILATIILFLFYQDVEEKDQHEVWRDQPVDVPLLGDGGDEGGEAVVAHEGVDANAEQVWNAWKVGNGRVGSASTCKSVKSLIETILRDVKTYKEMKEM